MVEGGWLGIAMPSRVRRLGARHHRSGGDDAGGCRVGRRHERRVEHPHAGVRLAAGRAVRHRRSRSSGCFRPSSRAKTRSALPSPSPMPGSTRPSSRPARRRRDGGYLVNGEKIWISTAQVANKMLLLARTTPLDEVKRKTEGLSLFYTSLDRSKIEVRLIHKMGRHAVDSNMLFIEDLWVPEEDRIGAEGRGLQDHPPRPQPGARPDRRRSDRHRPRRHRRGPRATRASASCSTGRSA